MKLLRVLQQREFSRLGSTRLIPLRARLVFATHRDLIELVAAGKFRQDFYYRINVMRIDCPALAEHPQDIPHLAHQFLQRYAHQYQRPIENIQPRALAMLESYSWPGNFRELENVIQRAIILAEGNKHSSGRSARTTAGGHAQPRKRRFAGWVFREAAARLQDKAGQHRRSGVQRHKTLAARSLNISRAYLHRLLRTSEQEIREIHVA